MSKRKIAFLLLSIVMAFGLWLYVVTVVSPESEETFYDVPVMFRNQGQLQDKELMLVMEENPEVDLRLTGNRSDLSRLNKSNITAMVDLSRIYEPGEHEVGYDVSFPAEVGSVGMVSKNPGTLKLVVERRIVDKPVDIVIEAKGSVPSDCMVSDEILSSQQVLVTGPKSVVDQITQARITVDYTDQSKTFEQVLKPTLCNAEGEPVDAQLVETDIASVEITVVVLKVKDVKLSVKVVDGGGATQETSDISILPESIKVAGTEEELAGLDVLELGTIHLADLAEDTTKEFAIKLPAGVQGLNDSKTAQVSIQFPELSIVELTVTEFEAINVPEGLVEEILAKSLTVRIRGPKDQMALITSADVKIVVDFKERQAGTFNVTAKVVIENPAYATAGAMGTYSVIATLAAEED